MKVIQLNSDPQKYFIYGLDIYTDFIVVERTAQSFSQLQNKVYEIKNKEFLRTRVGSVIKNDVLHRWEFTTIYVNRNDEQISPPKATPAFHIENAYIKGDINTVNFEAAVNFKNGKNEVMSSW